MTTTEKQVNDYRRASTPSGKNEPIVVFRGGGYDRCIWEWNAVFFDDERNVKPNQEKLCTGYKGKRVLAEAEKGLRAAYEAAKYEGRYGGEESYFLITHDASWSEFQSAFNKGFVRSVARAAGRTCQCDKCGKWFDPYEIYHTGYRGGNGGVGFQYDDNHCYQCAEDLHEEYCAKHIWKHESIEDRVAAVQKYREETGNEISTFAARNDEAPIPYNYYTSEPELY